MHVYVCEYMCVVYLCIGMHMYVCGSAYMYVCMYVFMYVCMYIKKGGREARGSPARRRHS